jgi:DMSO/TMAO reductase YedYZ molybdopterin-dependent catalytic subunit
MVVADDKPVGRRIVLGMLGFGAAGIIVGERVQAGLERFMRPITENDPTGLTSFVPTAGRFRIYTVVGFEPHRSDAEYRLKIGGMVRKPLDLSLADLRARKQTALKRDFQCVTGWRVHDVHWKGVLLRDLLDEAGVEKGATHLRFFSFDGTYTESLSLEQARRGDVMAAHEMLSGPVTQEHGGPVRLYVAPMYGYKSIKWLERIVVVDQEVPGYWEQLGYDVDGWVGRSNGRRDEAT